MSDITITNTRPEHIAALAEHQKICFPTLDPSEWMTAEHFASHLRLFPEGQHVALELVKDRRTREPAPDEVLAVVTRCAEHGLLTMRAGLYANCLRLLMPLVITDDQLQEGLDVLEEGLQAASDKVTR